MKKLIVVLLTGLLVVSLTGCSGSGSKADNKDNQPKPEVQVATVIEEFIKARHTFTYETYTGLEGLEEYTEDPIYSALMLNAEGFATKAKEHEATKEITHLGQVEVTMVDEEKAEAKVEFTVEWTKDGVTETIDYELTATLEKFEDKWFITLMNGPV